MGELNIVRMARMLRLGVVREQYQNGNLTEAEAIELLSGPLEPGNESTVYDDSGLLKATWKEIDTKLTAEGQKGE